MKSKWTALALLMTVSGLAACQTTTSGNTNTAPGVHWQSPVVPAISHEARMVETRAASERARTRNLRNEVVGIERYLVRHLGRDRAHILDIGDAVLVTINGAGSFEGNSDRLNAAGKDITSRVTASLLEYPHARVAVVGHARDMGHKAARAEQVRSDRRAVMMKAVMMQRGVDACRIGTLGRGAVDPVASGATQRTDQLNDRIEILIRPMQDGACN